MSVSCVSSERTLITPDISVDLVVFKIVRRVWRVINLAMARNQRDVIGIMVVPWLRRR